MPADHGPFESERQAHAAAIAAIPPEDGRLILRDSQNRQLIEDACAAAGVALGAFDRRIVDWLAGFDDSDCAVFAGFIRRAWLAGLEAGGDRIGFVVVTYNQASGRPGLDYPDLHDGITDAMCERDLKREETATAGRGERHVIAEVTEMEGEPGGS
jgi:hypothetical protein